MHGRKPMTLACCDVGIIGARPQLARDLPDRLAEHGVGGEDAQHRARDLDRGIGDRQPDRQLAPQGESEGDGRVGVRPGNGAEYGDQHHPQ